VAAEGAAAFCAEPMVKKKSMVQRKTALSARFMKGPQVETQNLKAYTSLSQA
jgi:hypothetical protein